MGKDTRNPDAAATDRAEVSGIETTLVLVGQVVVGIWILIYTALLLRALWALCIVFNEYPGGVQAVATIVLVLCTIAYISVVWRQGRTMQRQLQAIQEQERARIDRAVNTIIIEILSNAAHAENDLKSVLYDGGSQLLCALMECGVSYETISAISQAYLYARTYNQARMGPNPETKAKAWKDAQWGAKRAAAAIDNDPALRLRGPVDADHGAATDQ